VAAHLITDTTRFFSGCAYSPVAPAASPIAAAAKQKHDHEYNKDEFHRLILQRLRDFERL
jgi:hypothetical protein